MVKRYQFTVTQVERQQLMELGRRAKYTAAEFI